MTARKVGSPGQMDTSGSSFESTRFPRSENHARWLGLEREEARKAAWDFAKTQARLRFQPWTLQLDMDDRLLLQTTIESHMSQHASSEHLGLFSGEQSWDECRNFSSSLLSLFPNFTSAFPKCEADNSLQFFAGNESDLLTNEQWKVRESSGLGTAVKPAVVFCPGTLADLRGNRMGRGKGFYDRYFQDHSVYRILVIHENYIVPEFPSSWIQEGDQRVDAILSSQSFFPISSKEQR